jgi:2-phosphosulfolactate phosphatase
MGEVSGRLPEQFEFGNSPFEIDEVDVTRKMIIQRTSAGAQGVVAAARRASRLLSSVSSPGFVPPRWRRTERVP